MGEFLMIVGSACGAVFLAFGIAEIMRHTGRPRWMWRVMRNHDKRGFAVSVHPDPNSITCMTPTRVFRITRDPQGPFVPVSDVMAILDDPHVVSIAQARYAVKQLANEGQGK